MPGEAKIDGGALRRLLRAPGGIVGRDLVRRAQLVEAAAVAGCPVGSGPTAGRTRSTIKADRVPHETATGMGIYVHAGGAAIFLVKGTRPHVIRPRVKTILRFEVGGEVVWAKEVHHPGTARNDFLAEATKAAA